MSRLEKIKSKDKLVYSRTEESKEPMSFSGLYIFITILLIGGLVYLLVFSGLFNIKNIEITGYEHQETVKEMTKEEISKNIITKNILLFPTGSLKEKLLGDPNIKRINIKRILPNTIRLEIEEAKPVMIWVTAGDRLFIDDRGVIMGEAIDNNNLSLIEIIDASNIEVKVGERVASPTFIKFINDISSGFDTATGTKLIKITLFDLLEDVHILSSDGWTVYLNASLAADSQLKNLTRIIAEASKETKKLEYIDMRLDNKIFYK